MVDIFLSQNSISSVPRSPVGRGQWARGLDHLQWSPKSRTPFDELNPGLENSKERQQAATESSVPYLALARSTSRCRQEEVYVVEDFIPKKGLRRWS